MSGQPKSSFPLFGGMLAAALLAVSPSAQAQAPTAQLATPTVRVTSPVVSDQMVTLKGNVHPMAQARYDQGAASSSQATGTMEILLRRSPAQQQALREYIGGLQNPHSASYHKWLTPAAYGASFGVATEDVQAVENWLEGQGFKIEGVPSSANLIRFSGTFGQLTQAFHTNIHSYVINGVHHYSNASDPEIPAALAPVIAGISPMNDFHPRPLHVLGAHAQVQKVGSSLQVVRQAAGSSPQLTVTDSNNQNVLLLTPADAATIYDAPNSLNRNYTGSAQRNGTGVSIGLVGDSDLQTADYQNYRTLFLNETSPAAPTIVVDGIKAGLTGDAVEALVDTEFAAGLAPGASIYYYESNSDLFQNGIFDASLRAVEDNNVALLSVSYGNCEADIGPAGNQQWSELWQQAAAQGITALVAAGDNGSAACDNGTPTATGGLAVNGLASTPYNIAVGGTDFDLLGLANNFATYVNTSQASPTGTSPYALGYGTALGYIPENPWNDSITNNPPAAYTANTPAMYSDGSGAPPTTMLAAGGGGVSNSALCNGPTDQNGNCQVAPTGYTKPPFQSAVSGTVRSVPDVSLFASPGFEHQAAWAYCSDSTVDSNVDPGVTGPNCQVSSTGFVVGAIGGTSTSTPAFAGILAQVIQSLGTGQRLGLANNVIYNLAQSSYGTIFHDITVGNNSVPCTVGSINCTTTGFEAGYNAGSGYDLATGLGSVDIAQLVNGWDTASFAATTTTLQANNGTSAINAAHGTGITLSTTVAPSSAVGTVSVVATTTGQGGAAVNEDIPLTAGTGSVSVNDLPGGSYSIHAYYPGDATHAPSTSTAIPFVISPEASSSILELDIADLSAGTTQTNPASVPYGMYGYAYLQPANANAATDGSHGFATGTATLLNNGAVSSTQTLNSEGVAAFPLYNLAPSTYSFGAQYSGDGSYNASSTTANIGLIITKAPTALKIHTGTTNAANGSNIYVELDTDSAGAYPSGNVTLTVNGTAFVGSVSQALLADGAVEELASFAITPAALKTSGNKLSAAYIGDGNYNASNAGSCSYNPVLTTAASAATHPDSRLNRLLAGGSSVGLAFCFLFCIPARNRRLRSLLVVLLALGVMGAMGCGTSGSGTTTTTFNTSCSQ